MLPFFKQSFFYWLLITVLSLFESHQPNKMDQTCSCCSQSCHYPTTDPIVTVLRSVDASRVWWELRASSSVLLVCHPSGIPHCCYSCLHCYVTHQCPPWPHCNNATTYGAHWATARAALLSLLGQVSEQGYNTVPKSDKEHFANTKVFGHCYVKTRFLNIPQCTNFKNPAEGWKYNPNGV